MIGQNIAILGAGIMGLSAGYTLMNRGHRVTLFERDTLPPRSASSKAGGMLAPYSEIEHMNSSWIGAGLAGIAFWRDFAAAHGDIDFHSNGSLLIAHPEDRHVLERFRGHLPNELQDYVRPQSLEPRLPSTFQSGLSLPKEAHLNPTLALEKLFSTIQNQGVRTLSQEIGEVKDIAGEYDTVIDCRGMGANDPALRGVKGELLIVRNEDFALSRPVRIMHPRYPLYIVPRADHVFMIGATIIESAESEQVNLRSAMELMSALYALHPSFGDAEILEITAGIRPSYRDNLPRIKTEGNIISLNGSYRHGFLIAPVMAEALADRLEGKTHAYMSLFEGGANADHHYDQRAA